MYDKHYCKQKGADLEPLNHMSHTSYLCCLGSETKEKGNPKITLPLNL